MDLEEELEMVANLQEVILKHETFIQTSAKIAKKMFEAFKAEGFSHEEAMQLTASYVGKK